MVFIWGINSYQCRETQDSIIQPENQRSERKSSTSILRKHYSSRFHVEFWGKNITQTTDNFGKNLESLSGNEYQTTSGVYIIIFGSIDSMIRMAV
ncbi:hypothetical protein AYI68_g5076 [Smittium mucronatum]|uniref:Uncharacterized protein n=1 Tax=Smittium mucronatum TaxID=133383 RepID=A0A1R0GVA3_9FUNG|nr:hypothetical protein AYI68_g5076 [Smittium mucronatum]